MNILCVGDVCGSIGCRHLLKLLPKIKRENNIDLVIVNGENSADGNGITPQSADMIFAAGADVITGGNHSFRRKEIFERYDSDSFLLRPHNINFRHGSGYTKIDLGAELVAVINLVGRVYMPDAAEPFEIAKALVEKAHSNGIKTIVVDFHAEATAEKKALAYYLDGLASVVFGTHTHVATADEQILPLGTGFITDIGMTGPNDSILGVKKELSIMRIKDGTPVKFELAEGDCRLDACIFEIDRKSGKVLNVKRINVV